MQAAGLAERVDQRHEKAKDRIEKLQGGDRQAVAEKAEHVNCMGLGQTFPG